MELLSIFHYDFMLRAYVISLILQNKILLP
jgi:hypothetical protein